MAGGPGLVLDEDLQTVFAERRLKLQDVQQETDKGLRNFMTKRLKDDAKAFLVHIDNHMKNFSEWTTNVCRDIAAEVDQHYADKLSLNVLRPEKQAGTLLRAITDHMRREHGPEVLIEAGLQMQNEAGPQAQNIPVIVIDSDTDESDGDENSRAPSISREGQQRTAIAAGTQNKRTRGPEPDSALSQSKRAQHSYHTRQTYDIPESEPEDDPAMRTIQDDEVAGRDFIFDYPPGSDHFAVVRCDGDEHISGNSHRFEYHPLRQQRALKHFRSDAPKSRCHDIDVVGSYTDEQVMNKFGYRVVDTDGNDVSSDWVESSNLRLAAELEKQKSKGKAKGKAPATSKGKETAHPRLGPVEFRDLDRTLYRAAAAAATTTAPGSRPSATIPGTTTPIASTSAAASIPVADMRVGGLHSTPTLGHHGYIGQQPEVDYDAYFDPVISDLVPT